MTSDRLRRLAVPLIALSIALAVLGATLFLTLRPQDQADGIGGSYALVSHDGRPVTEQTFRGKPHLVFFGFTHCPDVCPATLFNISEALRATGERGRDLRALFISVDPERDTPAVLKEYVSSFDERIVGLTGSQAQVDAAVKAFRSFARKAPGKDGDYTMEHTSYVYLMDKAGRFVGTFGVTRPPEQAAADLLKHL
jgi:protein SCO1/2